MLLEAKEWVISLLSHLCWQLHADNTDLALAIILWVAGKDAYELRTRQTFQLSRKQKFRWAVLEDAEENSDYVLLGSPQDLAQGG